MWSILDYTGMNQESNEDMYHLLIWKQEDMGPTQPLRKSCNEEILGNKSFSLNCSFVNG